MNTEELFPLSSARPVKKDIQKILSTYLRHWYLFVIGVVVSGVIAFLYLRYVAIPKYEVTSTLLIRESTVVPDLSTITAFNGGQSTKSANSPNNVILLLKSRALMQRVVNDLNLTTVYSLEGVIRNSELYGPTNPVKAVITRLDSTVLGKSFKVKIESGNTFTLTDYTEQTTTHRFGEQIKKPYGLFTIIHSSSVANEEAIIIQFKDANQVIKEYNEALTVGPVSAESSVIELNLREALPHKGEAILNKLLELYTQESLKEKSYAINNTIEFLDERLKYITGNLSKVEQQVEQYKRSNELTDVNSQASNYVEQANTYNKNLSEWSIQIEVLESIEQYLTDNQGQYKLIPSTLGIQDPTLMSLITKLNELQTERERMLRSVKPTNPLVQNLNEQLANLRLNILENLKNIKNGLIITSNNYKANSEQFKSKIGKIPSIERDLIEINRQQSIKQNIYTYLLQKREESSLAKAAIIPDSEIIDAAYSSEFPLSPNKMTIYIVALMLGLGLPFMYVFAVGLLNDKVQSGDDVTALTHVPLLGEVPHYELKDRVVVQNTHHPIVERFGLIRAKLLFSQANESSRLLVITSSSSGEGKTFFSINLAQSLALTEKKVLLLELDLRKPSFSSALALDRSLGVTDYLTSDNITIDNLLQYADKVPNLPIISAGTVATNAAELLMSKKLIYLLEELKSTFDYIIVDSSPVGQVADILSINQLVSSTVFLTRCNVTPKQSITSFDTMVRDSMIVNPLLIVNDVNESSKADYVDTKNDKLYGKKGEVLS